MICTDIDGYRFMARAGGIAICNGKVLLNKNCAQDYWFMPGGRIEAGEESREAIIREMKEEIGRTIDVKGLRCVIENFFTENGKKYHEIAFYYEMYVGDVWEGNMYIKDGGADIEYAWIDVADIDSVELYPKIMKRIIRNEESGNHFIVRD